MTTYEVGQSIARSVAVTSDGSTPANVGAMTCDVTKPDGTTATASVTNPSTGRYVATYTASMSGRHYFVWTATGANSGAFPYTDIVDVWQSGALARLIIPISDAKASLNIPSSVTTNDDEIRLYIAAATDYIENLTGPLLTATGQTWTADGGTPAVLLPVPVSAVTGVTVDGTATTSYTVDPVAGIVYAGTGSSAGSTRFASGKANVVVTYTVGASTVPPAAVLAARELIRYWYATSQMGGRPAFGGNTDTGGTETFFPARRVEQILAPLMNAVPGMA